MESEPRRGPLLFFITIFPKFYLGACSLSTLRLDRTNTAQVKRAGILSSCASQFSPVSGYKYFPPPGRKLVRITLLQGSLSVRMFFVML